MDIEEIEDFYAKELESLDKQFLYNLKKGKNKKELENNYKKRLSEIRKEYENHYKKFLKTHKIFNDKKSEENKEKKKKQHRFTVKPLKLKTTRKEKFSIKWKLFKFHFKIKWNNFKNKVTPKFLIIFKIRTRIAIENTKTIIKNTLSRFGLTIKENSKAFGSVIKIISTKILKSITKSILKILSKITSIFKKKKEKGKKEMKNH